MLLVLLSHNIAYHLLSFTMIVTKLEGITGQDFEKSRFKRNMLSG